MEKCTEKEISRRKDAGKRDEPDGKYEVREKGKGEGKDKKPPQG